MIYYQDISYIDFFSLKKNSTIKAICFDKDNCLTLPYDNKIYGPIKEAFEISRSLFQVAILSNSIGGTDDNGLTHSFESQFDIPVIRHLQKVKSGSIKSK
jgi:phosphatidylglycerophosphatase GEP4